MYDANKHILIYNVLYNTVWFPVTGKEWMFYLSQRWLATTKHGTKMQFIVFVIQAKDNFIKLYA